MASINIVKGTCLECERTFTYVRYRADKSFCSKSCQNRNRYKAGTDYALRRRRLTPTEDEKKRRKAKYDREYARRPEVRARKNARQRLIYSTQAYRDYALDRWYRLYRGKSRRISIPDIYMGYSGPEFAALREIVGQPPQWNTPWFDDWAERMGTAVLAEAEGRDIEEALKKYRKSEYIPKYRTVRLGEIASDPFALDKILATEDLTEKEALEKIARAEAPQVQERFSMGSNTSAYGKGYNKTRTRPTRRGKYRPWQDRPGHRRHA